MTRSEIERAIEYWEEFEREIDEMPHSEILEAQREPVRTALRILRAELDRERNEPLTMKEIKELYEKSFSGYPVWCRYLNEYSYPFGAVIDRYDGEIVAVHAAGLEDHELNYEEDYGKTWLAYRYEPKGATK